MSRLFYVAAVRTLGIKKFVCYIPHEDSLLE